MTEDAAVFGGLNNMVDGLANAYSLYKPDMIAVSTTCMAEVIGDDLNAFIKTARKRAAFPKSFDVPFAHTPAFVGSHITGYDNALKGVLRHFWDGKAKTTEPLVRVPTMTPSTSLVGSTATPWATCAKSAASSTCLASRYNIICDPSDVWNTPTDGEFRMYDGGTTWKNVAALHAKATIVLQEYCCEKRSKFIAEHGQEVVA
jgi:nitrogenase molybdenum-iron protein beta chain